MRMLFLDSSVLFLSRTLLKGNVPVFSREDGHVHESGSYEDHSRGKQEHLLYVFRDFDRRCSQNNNNAKIYFIQLL